MKDLYPLYFLTKNYLKFCIAFQNLMTKGKKTKRESKQGQKLFIMQGKFLFNGEKVKKKKSIKKQKGRALQSMKKGL